MINGDVTRVLSLVLFNRVLFQIQTPLWYTSIASDICLVGTEIWAPACRQSQNVLLVSERSRIAVDGFVEDFPEDGAAGSAACGGAAGGAGGAGS